MCLNKDISLSLSLCNHSNVLTLVCYCIFCVADVDECLLVPCAHESTCINFMLSYNCSCTSGYEGDHCEIGTTYS